MDSQSDPDCHFAVLGQGRLYIQPHLLELFFSFPRPGRLRRAVHDGSEPKPLRPLLPEDDFQGCEVRGSRWTIRVTPAMEAGIANHVWTLNGLAA